MDWGRDPASPGTVRSGRSAHERRATVAAAGKIDVGGDLTVNRLGFGAMRITGPDRGHRGHPRGPRRGPLAPGERAASGPGLAADPLAAGPAIPGLGVPDHVEQNVAAASLELTPEEIRAITRAVVAACGVS